MGSVERNFLRTSGFSAGVVGSELVVSVALGSEVSVSFFLDDDGGCVSFSSASSDALLDASSTENVNLASGASVALSLSGKSFEEVSGSCSDLIDLVDSTG